MRTVIVFFIAFIIACLINTAPVIALLIGAPRYRQQQLSVIATSSSRLAATNGAAGSPCRIKGDDLSCKPLCSFSFTCTYTLALYLTKVLGLLFALVYLSYRSDRRGGRGRQRRQSHDRG